MHQCLAGERLQHRRLRIATRLFQPSHACPHFLRTGVFAIGLCWNSCFVAGMPRIDLGMQSVMEGPVKLIRIRPLEHHGQVFAIGPVRLIA